MEYESKWYWCDVIDGFEVEDVQEPRWEKIPPERRNLVRTNWLNEINEKLKPQRLKLWGPQIEWYMKQSQYKIKVIGLV